MVAVGYYEMPLTEVEGVVFSRRTRILEEIIQRADIRIVVPGSREEWNSETVHQLGESLKLVDGTTIDQIASVN